MDSIQLCQTVSNLMSVCGNIDKPGTNLLVRNGFEINPGYATAQLYCDPDTFAKKLTVDLVHPGCVQFIGMADCDAVNRAFETGEPYPIKMAWIPGFQQHRAARPRRRPRVHKMLSSVEFCVVADPYMTPVRRRLRRHLPALEDHRRARLHARVVDPAARHEEP